MSAVARSRPEADLRALGLRPGSIAMVHTRMSAIGWVVGAAETVVRALLDVLGRDGTLVAYVRGGVARGALRSASSPPAP